MDDKRFLGLSDDELERLSKLPLRNADAECAMAREMLSSRKSLWAESHPAETVVINARTMKELFGLTHDEAMTRHKLEHGPSWGDYMIAQLLPRG